MKTLVSIAITLGFFVGGAAYAAAPADAPAGTTGQCKDGTYTSAAAKKGACHGHQGVKAWYAADEEPQGDCDRNECFHVIPSQAGE